ncbi:MAG: extracellular solute-binding protein [Chloroflexi bacterium]|nr:extracellular solute-binding protein [Chloroflexota bacterium]
MTDTVVRAPRRVISVLAAGVLLAACSTSPASSPSAPPATSEAPETATASTSTPASTLPEPSGTVRVYTSVTQDTVDAVLAAYAEAAPDVTVEVFRAPTGELDARIAAELRDGQIGGDVLWGTDPLSVQSYAAQDLLAAWSPPEAASVPEEYQTDTFWGTRLLNMLIVHAAEMADPPTDWADLTDPAYADGVGIPDPGFAGSAFAVLAYFESNPDFGIEYYEDLAENGAVQVQAVAEVLTGVAEGRFVAGMTLDKSARDAIAQGSPIEIAWPASGAIALYSPVAVFADAEQLVNGQHFANFLLTREAQEAIASTGWQPIRDDVEGPPIEGEQVSPDWDEVFDRQEELLMEYRAIFGG